jgi:hypothetical protein
MRLYLQISSHRPTQPTRNKNVFSCVFYIRPGLIPGAGIFETATFQPINLKKMYVIKLLSATRAQILELMPGAPPLWHYTGSRNQPATQPIEAGQEVSIEIPEALRGIYERHRTLQVSGVWINYTKTLPPDITLVITKASTVTQPETITQ